LVVNGLAELPAARWMAANLILLAFAALVWTVSAFMAFVVKSSGAVLVIVSLVGLFGNAGVLYVAPGLVVLAGPLIGGTIFNLRTAQTELATPLIVSLAAQFLVGAIFFAGAARKYRRPEGLALGAWLGLGLLLAIVGVSLLAILRPEEFVPRFLAYEFGRMDAAVPVCGSTVLALMIALIPLCNFARLHVGWVKGRTDEPERRRPVPPLAVAAVIVTGALSLMMFAFREPPGTERAACLIAAFFGFCVSVVFLAAWFYRSVESAKLIVGLWLACYCLGPLVVDFARSRMSEREWDEPVLATAASFSPIGMLIEVVTRAKVDLRPGAVFHAVVPLLPVGLYVKRKTVTSSIPR
jgi:hypothetical protein